MCVCVFGENVLNLLPCALSTSGCIVMILSYTQAMVEQEVVYLHFDTDKLVPNPSVLKAPTPTILAVGPNPAYQKTLTFNHVCD